MSESSAQLACGEYFPTSGKITRTCHRQDHLACPSVVPVECPVWSRQRSFKRASGAVVVVVCV
jgi:hypothetical protein